MFRKTIQVALIAILSLLVSQLLLAQTVMKEGHSPGYFTMDYEAAKTYAAKNKLPIFLNFTGSDWCSWCKLMQSSVFSQKEWDDWVVSRMVLVTLDFPQDQNIVPEKYRARNDSLSRQFGIRGYPTYVVLDWDGKSELGRLGAGQDKTAASFIAELKALLRFSESSIRGFETKISGTALETYKAAVEDLIKQRNLLNPAAGGAASPVDAAMRKVEGLQESFALTVMTRAEKKRFQTEKKKYDRSRAEIDAWIKTDPPNTDANRKKYADFLKRIDSSRSVMDQLLEKYLKP